MSEPRKGLLLILSSPSGAGKSSLARRLLDSDPSMQFSVSATTRAPRRGEVDGREYYFRTDAEFLEMVDAGEMLEHAEVFGHRYGTPRAPVEAAIAAGRDVIFDVDWQGGKQIRASDLAPDVVSVFILPPSIAELDRRLHARNQDSADTVERRMKAARSEISHWDEYDFVLTNDDFDRCTQDLQAILSAERLRRFRQTALAARIDGLYAEFDGS